MKRGQRKTLWGGQRLRIFQVERANNSNRSFFHPMIEVALYMKPE
jgi:hypothetical protein